MTKNLKHDSAKLHVSGQAVFIDDILINSEVLCGYVFYSPHPLASITSYNFDIPAKLEGIHKIITYKDIPGLNQMGPVVNDELVLAENEVTFIGQAIFIIVAESEEMAHNAARRIRITFETADPVLSIGLAMVKNSTIQASRKIESGKVNDVFHQAIHTTKGEIKTGAQEHWYLETQVALAIPKEENNIEVYSSTQSPSHTQTLIAQVLGLKNHEVEVEVKRIGGAFGGKETQANHVAIWAALAAFITKRPVKIRLSRNDDQIITGKRHPFQIFYKVAFTDEGKISAFDAELNSNAGSSTDLSMAILDRALFHADSSYFIPNFRAVGTAWKTNLPSNTAFRGFGGPQGMMAIENAIDKIARLLKKDAAEIRKLNFYGENSNNTTPYGQIVENNKLHKLWDKLIENSNYYLRKAKINYYNSIHKYTKRGIALIPVKFGISFTTSFLNQAGAMINIYEDGSILVNHGGTEMGQGLHTKIQQITAIEFGVDQENIKVNATNTSKVPNTSSTAASSGTDLNGMAVKDAVRKLKYRMATTLASNFTKQNEEFISSYKDICFENNQIFDSRFPERTISFKQACKLMHFQQVSLSATGFYKIPGIYYNQELGQGNPFLYYAFGMSVSEVEIDVLTGFNTILRTDILHDVGDSINPKIDIGQIEGAFIQGVGWCTTEECKHDTSGNLLNNSPDTYKIPTISDLPRIFNVELLQDATNSLAIHGSKAVGEPPLIHCFSVWFAIKDAISAIGNHEFEPDLSIPATNEEILKSIDKINLAMIKY